MKYGILDGVLELKNDMKKLRKTEKLRDKNKVIESLSIKIIHSWTVSPMRINKDLIVWI